ncbi:MAG: hypothetical protein O2987_04025 [Firmicutes bacterium]|nr:hypothetical protein [Bacillota bacterium]
MISLLVLSYVDSFLEKKKELHKKKKESLYYDIFYPEMMSSIMNASFKIQYNHQSLWPYQESYFKRLIHVISEQCSIILYQFKIQNHQKPSIKVLFKMPFQSLPLTYLNHTENLNTQPFIANHHYVYHVQNQNHNLITYLDHIERCPHLLDIEMIFNGQDAMFMCKIEGMGLINDFNLKDKTFKKHQERLIHIYAVYNYLIQSLKELEDAYRK